MNVVKVRGEKEEAKNRTRTGRNVECGPGLHEVLRMKKGKDSKIWMMMDEPVI